MLHGEVESHIIIENPLTATEKLGWNIRNDS